VVKVSESDKRHWNDLVDAFRAEASALGGWGEVTVRVTYHEGVPLMLDVLERNPRYRLGSGLPQLTRFSGADRMQSDK
jgi:hypothetical protein